MSERARTRAHIRSNFTLTRRPARVGREIERIEIFWQIDNLIIQKKKQKRKKNFFDSQYFDNETMVKEFVNTLLRIYGYIEYRISKFTGNVANGLLFILALFGTHSLLSFHLFVVAAAAVASFLRCTCSWSLFVFFLIVVLYFLTLFLSPIH